MTPMSMSALLDDPDSQLNIDGRLESRRFELAALLDFAIEHRADSVTLES